MRRPALGRFISEDPLEFGGGSTNLYSYAGNDPVDYTDPSGGQFIGGCVGGAAINVGADFAMHVLSGRKFTVHSEVHSGLLGCAAGMVGAGLGTAFDGLTGEAVESRAVQSYYPPNAGFWGNVEQVTLSPGSIIDRFGNTAGRFASPAGTPTWARSLPYGVENRPLGTYEVIQAIEVSAGKVAGWFGQPGGGVQYELGTSIQDLLDRGFLRALP